MQGPENPFRLERRNSKKSRAFWMAAFLLVFIAAAIPRLVRLGASLWAAEAWVANSIMAESMHHMFFHDTWLQTTPPLFLLLARTVVKLLGASNLTLRMLPFAFGTAAVVLTACLAVRLFRFPAALLCTVMVALAPTAIRYSLELKQYTGDLAFTSAMLLALWLYLENHRRAHLWIMALFAGGVFLSHASVMFVPLAACVLAFARREEPLALRLRRCALFLVLVGLVGALQYFYFARPNISTHLDHYWDRGFLQSFRPRAIALFYAHYFAAAAFYFFLPDQFADPLVVLLGIPWPVRLFLGVFLVAALVIFVNAIRRDARKIWILFFCVAPMLALLPLNLLHLYPVSSRRLMLFLLPCVSIGLVLVIETLWQEIRHRLPGRLPGFVAVVFGVFCVFSSFALAAQPALWNIKQTEDMEGAVRYLKSVVQPEDLVFVHGSAVESVELYVRLLKWPNPPVVYGKTGFPCCIRDLAMQAGSGDVSAIQQDVSRLIEQKDTRVLWLMGGVEGGEEFQTQLRYLARRGCLAQPEGTFAKVDLYRLRCSSSPFPAKAKD